MPKGFFEELFVEKGPYALTILVAAVGWSVPHIVGHLSGSPTVEFRLTNSAVAPTSTIPIGTKKVEARLHNLSLKETFYDLVFFIRPERGSKLNFSTDKGDRSLCPEVIPHAPLWFGEQHLDPEQLPIEISGPQVLYRVPQLPPDGQISLIAYYQGEGEPALQAQLDSKRHSSMRLVRASLDTFILRNESLVIAQSLLIFLFGYAAFWIARSQRWIATLIVAICGVGLVLWTTTAYADDANVVVKKVHVFDVDRSHDIPSEVQVMAHTSAEPSHFTDVDENGLPSPPKPPPRCAPMSKLTAKVGDDYVRMDKPQLCAREVTLRVRRTPSPMLAEVMNDDRAWASQAGDYYNQRHSTLRQINVGNVRRLQVAWTMSTGVLRGHEGAPLVIGTTMYIHTPYPNNVYAINLKDQTYRWKYEPKQDPDIVPVMCCDTVNRGLAYDNGRIFLQQADTTLVALDAGNGKVLWSVKNGDPKIGETNTNAPHVFKDKVLTGISGGEFGVRGRMHAYDTKTGKPIWKAYSTGPDNEMLIDPAKTMTWANGKMTPVGKNSSLNSWKGDQWKLGGGTTWGWYSYDPKLNLVYYGTGNPGTWNPAQRPGDNKWSMSIFARDLDTGVAKWVYQMTPHDEWDFDGVNEMVLLDAKDNDGQITPALVHFDRNGFGYTLNRETGALLVAEKFDPQVNWATKVDMKTGRPVVDRHYSPGTTGPDVDVKGICPAALGSKDEQPSSYDPNSGLVFVPTNHVCMTYEPFQVEYTAGQPYVGATLSLFPTPNSHGGMGNFIAWDPRAGKIAWSKPEHFSVWSGVLTTDGNIAFYGTLEGYIKAVSTKDGSELWKFKTPSGIIGNVFTYEVEGKQYVGVYSGVGGWAGIGIAAGLTESTAGLGAVGAYKDLARYTTLGGSLFIFALPDN
jgi:lanthanide-dependent methanol dehydrogenase